MTRRGGMVTGEVVIETYVDGTGASDRPEVMVLPSHGRDGGEDFDGSAATLSAAG